MEDCARSHSRPTPDRRCNLTGFAVAINIARRDHASQRWQTGLAIALVVMVARAPTMPFALVGYVLGLLAVAACDGGSGLFRRGFHGSSCDSCHPVCLRSLASISQPRRDGYQPCTPLLGGFDR